MPKRGSDANNGYVKRRSSGSNNMNSEVNAGSSTPNGEYSTLDGIRAEDAEMDFDSEKLKNKAKDAYKKSKDKAKKDDKKDKKDDKKDDLKNDKLNKKGQKGQKGPNKKAIAKGATDGALLGGKSYIGSKLMMALKMFLEMMAQAASAATAAVSGFFGTLVSGIMSIATTVAGFVGTTVTVGLGLVTTGFVAVVGFVGAVGGALFGRRASNDAAKDGRIIDCSVAVDKARGGAEIDAEAQTLENAKKIYSVYKTFGLDDKHIAAALGSFHIESGGMDPTMIEGYFGERFTMGPKKTKMAKDFTAYCTGPLEQAYINDPTVHPATGSGYFCTIDKKRYPGLGLAQWTGGNGYKLINTAKSAKKEWYDLDYQIAYSLATGSPSNGGAKGVWWNNFQKESGSLDALTEYFLVGYEGIRNSSLGQRQEKASEWYSAMKKWSVDKSYADGIIKLANTIESISTDMASAKAVKKCVKETNYDNSTLADAAVSYAYETKEQATGDDGTKLYRHLMHVIFPGDTNFQSCDRGMSVAVNWSGTDTDYPAGGCGNQTKHVSTSKRWKKVGSCGSMDYKKLKPGDILLAPGHTMMYVGEEAVKKKYPKSDGDTVEASQNTYSPCVCRDVSYFIKYDVDPTRPSNGSYDIYRCVKPEKSTKFKDAGSSLK